MAPREDEEGEGEEGTFADEFDFDAHVAKLIKVRPTLCVREEMYVHIYW